MNDEKTPPPGSAQTRSDLDVRLSEIERRLGRLEDRSVAPGDRLTEVEAELGVLRQAVEDLAAGNLDLNNQLVKLVSSCERILAGAGETAIETQGRGGLRRSASAVGRVTRRAVRGTIGAARRMVSSHDDGESAPADVKLIQATEPVRAAPRIAVVIRVADDPDSLEIPPEMRDQTARDLAVVLWNEAASKAAIHRMDAAPEFIGAADRAAVAAAVEAEFVADLASPLPRLHPATFELCSWTTASERLPLVVADDGNGPARRSWALVPVDDWIAPTEKNAAGRRSKLSKMVGGRTWGSLEALGSPAVDAGFGRAYLPAAGTRGSPEHRIAPLEGVASAAAAEDDRPAVLVLLSARGGEIATWLLRVLGDEFRFVVLLAGSEGGAPLLRGLTELAWRVYPVDRYLEPVVWPSLAADLARAHQVRTVLRIGALFDLPSFEAAHPVVVDLPLDDSDLQEDPDPTLADLTLALGRDIAAAARKRGGATRSLVPGPAPVGEIPQTDFSEDVRSAYGVPEGARLVMSVCDLEPGDRPEDVAAVARRLRHREDIHLLLIGRGTLAGAVSDLAGYFELERFTFAPPGHSMAELLASCDCVLGTAEVDPWPVAMGFALALGRSVVATEVDGVRELVEAANGDRSILVPPGNVDALAAAVVEALDTHRKPRVTKKAWNAAGARGSGAADVFRDALGGGPVGERETP